MAMINTTKKFAYLCDVYSYISQVMGRVSVHAKPEEREIINEK